MVFVGRSLSSIWHHCAFFDCLLLLVCSLSLHFQMIFTRVSALLLQFCLNDFSSPLSLFLNVQMFAVSVSFVRDQWHNNCNQYNRFTECLLCSTLQLGHGTIFQLGYMLWCIVMPIVGSYHCVIATIMLDENTLNANIFHQPRSALPPSLSHTRNKT